MDNDNISKINEQIKNIYAMGEEDSSREVIIDRKYAYDNIGDTKRIDSIDEIDVEEEEDNS